MEKRIFLFVLVGLVIVMTGQSVMASNGLKVNLSADTNGASGSGEYCVSAGGGDTDCQNSQVPGEVQFNVGNVGEGTSLKGCVSFGGNVECDTGENTDCKCPENLHVNFEGNDGGSSSSSAASSSSSTSSSSSSSNIGDIIINNLGD